METGPRRNSGFHQLQGPSRKGLSEFRPRQRNRKPGENTSRVKWSTATHTLGGAKREMIKNVHWSYPQSLVSDLGRSCSQASVTHRDLALPRTPRPPASPRQPRRHPGPRGLSPLCQHFTHADRPAHTTSSARPGGRTAAPSFPDTSAAESMTRGPCQSARCSAVNPSSGRYRKRVSFYTPLQ